jgi:hypothetical protein
MPEFWWQYTNSDAVCQYKGKSTVSNTSWPGIRIKRALPRKFPYLRYEVLHRWTHRVPYTLLGFDLISGSGRSSASPRGFESGDSNLSKLTNVFATMQLTGSDVSLRLVMPIPLSTKLCFFEARSEHYSSQLLLINELFVCPLCLYVFIGRAKEVRTAE